MKILFATAMFIVAFQTLCLGFSAVFLILGEDMWDLFFISLIGIVAWSNIARVAYQFRSPQ